MVSAASTAASSTAQSATLASPATVSVPSATVGQTDAADAADSGGSAYAFPSLLLMYMELGEGKLRQVHLLVQGQQLNLLPYI